MKLTDEPNFFDPVRGDPPDDCDVLGWSCGYIQEEQLNDDRNRNDHRNAMEMAAGGRSGSDDAARC